MARRKVTMLEAFQRSARESAERVAAERRRVIAEREKEIRRAEASRTAHELGHRLSQRAGDSVGSIIAGIRGAGVEAEAHDDAHLADGAGPDGSMAGSGSSDPSVGGPATDINRVPPLEVHGDAGEPGGAAESPGSKRSGPALPAFDRATHEDLTQVATGPRAGSLPAGSSRAHPGTHSSATGAGATHAPGEAAVASNGELADDATPGSDVDEDPFGDATSEEVEHAIASLESDVFELPMSARTFSLVAAAVIAAVFMMGYSVGTRNAPASSPVSPGLRGVGSSSLGFDETALPRRSGSLEGSLEGPGVGPGAGSVDASGLAYAGRSGAGEAFGAAEGDVGVVPAAGGREATLALSEEALTPEDLTFRSPSMKYTIMVITYSGTDAHARMAMETYDYLYSEGFPVIHPIEGGDSRIFVFVGAAETQAELEGLRGELRELRSGQGGSQEFRTAFIVNIDPYR